MKTSERPRPFHFSLLLFLIGSTIVVGLIVWQAIALNGVPDPLRRGLSPAAAGLSSGILVFREGLEAVLVLAAVTAGVVRNRHDYWRSVLAGAGAAAVATVATWFIVVAIISSIGASALAVQAATGLLAIVVLLVVMNWFFHKIYWTGWISQHGKRKQKILKRQSASRRGISIGLALLGFTAVYREGFEVVLFLQDLRLRAGNGVVLGGASVGAALALLVAGLTFAAHQRLPYKRMLVLTGLLLAGVLVVMVGESAQEMQQTGWLSAHQLPFGFPDWMGVWFAAFPTWEGVSAQFLAALAVFGSYFFVRGTVARSVPVEPTLKARRAAHQGA